MPASSFLSRATRLARCARRARLAKLGTLASLALTVFVAPSCRSLEIWGQSTTEMRRRLESGEHSFLREIDFGRHSVDEALQIGEHAPYFLALAFQSMGLDSQASQLFRLQVEQGDTPWNAFSLPPLLELLLRDADYETVIRLAAAHLSGSPDPINRDLVRKALIEALYWKRDDRAALAALATHFPSGRSAAEPQIDAELALFRAVASARAAAEGWPDLFLRLGLDHPASAIHVRAAQFLAKEDGIRSGLAAPARALIEAKAALAAGQPAAALGPLEGVIANLGDGAPDSLLRETVTAYAAAGQAGRGAQFFGRAAQSLAGPLRLAALEAAGRLYRAAGSNGDATRFFAALADATPDPAQRDRAAWYLAEMAAKGSARAGLTTLLRARASWNSPLYFDDLIDSLTTRLLAENDREGLRMLFEAVSGLEVPSRIRLYYILHRLGERGSPGTEALLATPSTTILEDYYRLLLNGDGAPSETEPPPADKAGEMDFLMAGLLDFGLYDRAMALARRGPGFVSRAARMEASRRLAARLRYKDAISLIGSGYPWNARGLATALVAYPKAYERDIRDLAGREKLDEGLLFALAREESAFDPTIVSSAGAIGLTQLLPSTAAEEARRMRISAYDLRSVSDNLSIGTHYLGRLVRLQESVPLGLAAYNAGLTRVRQWKQQFSHLPLDLLFEAIPFEETRHYLRKIFVSSATYDALYEKASPRQTVDMFFPAESR